MGIVSSILGEHDHKCCTVVNNNNHKFKNIDRNEIVAHSIGNMFEGAANHFIWELDVPPKL